MFIFYTIFYGEARLVETKAVSKAVYAIAGLTIG